jgi:hypothetical protein
MNFVLYSSRRQTFVAIHQSESCVVEREVTWLLLFRFPDEILEMSARKNWTSIMRCFEHKNACGGGGSVNPSVLMLKFEIH